MKTVVIIDGPHLTGSIRALPNYQLDYSKFIQLLRDRYAPLLKVVYYDARLPDSPAQARFFSALRDLGYEVHTQDVARTGASTVLKGFDVQIAVDMQQWAGSADRIVLVSGDADFAPALEALPRKGVVAEILAFRSSASRNLLRATANFTDLLELLPGLTLSAADSRRSTSSSSLLNLKPIDPEEALINRAALAGIRLERTLRNLCTSKGLTIKHNAGLDALNSALLAAGVYDKLVQKRIVVWSEIRNRAAHGLTPHYTSKEVEEMESWIEAFLAKQGA